MPQSQIAGIGYYVPQNIFTNDDLKKYMDTSDEWIQERTGIQERRFAHRTNETTTTMGVQAVRVFRLKRALVLWIISKFTITRLTTPTDQESGFSIMMLLQ